MPETDNNNTPRSAGYLSVVTAILLGLVAVEEAATTFMNGVPALWTALENAVSPGQGVSSAKGRATSGTPSQPETFGLADYLGDWRNRDPQTNGLARLWLHNEGTVLKLQVWGSCHPTDCDWGTVNASTFLTSVGSQQGKDIRSVEASFNHGFSESSLVIQLVEKSTLTVTTSTHFTDQSGRSNYQMTDSFLSTAPAR